MTEKIRFIKSGQVPTKYSKVFELDTIRKEAKTKKIFTNNIFGCQIIYRHVYILSNYLTIRITNLFTTVKN